MDDLTVWYNRKTRGLGVKAPGFLSVWEHWSSHTHLYPHFLICKMKKVNAKTTHPWWLWLEGKKRTLLKTQVANKHEKKFHNEKNVNALRWAKNHCWQGYRTPGTHTIKWECKWVQSLCSRTIWQCLERLKMYTLQLSNSTHKCTP